MHRIRRSLFAQQIEAAEKVSDKKDSVYNEEKEAYETLKEQTKAFKKGGEPRCCQQRRCAEAD